MGGREAEARQRQRDVGRGKGEEKWGENASLVEAYIKPWKL